MVEPISMAAVAAVLGAVGSGMANEAGKWAWESAGGLVRRIAGREVAAPGNPAEVDAVARLVYDGVRSDPQLARAWATFAGGVQRPGAVVGRPFLPASIRSFTDRREAIKQLDEEARRKADGRPRLALLYGPEGMGITTLARHWGVRAAERFPDGQMYVDLRGGSSGTALDAARVLGELLQQLGLPDEELPPAFPERQELFQGFVADRRLVVILDHAQSAAQVLPVIGSAPEVFTIVGARHALVGLDALRIPIGPLNKRDSKRLLTALVDKSALAAARAAVPSVLARCAGSPYAIRAAAPRLTAPLEEASTVSHSDSDPVRAAAEDSYRLLDPGPAQLYRLAALCGLPAFDAASAARAADVERADAEGWLEVLAESMLLERIGNGRYHYRSGVRAHAEAVAAREDGIVACSAAMNRVVEAQLRLAVGAARAALPESWRIPGPVEGMVPFADRGAAVAALAAETGNLVRVMSLAEEFRDQDTVVRLGQALWPLQLKAGRHDVLLPALRTAVRVADEHVPGTREAGALHAQLAHTLTELRRWEEAETEALAAARDEQAAGHVRGHASVVEFLGLLRLRQWRFQEAYDCFEESYAIYGRIGPDDEGADHLPRALALLDRHRGRALRGLQRRAEARELLERALAFFRASGEAYNSARTLTDLAETRLDGEEFEEALPLVDEAIAALAEEKAEYHLAHLRVLRERCVSPE
ncbi:hypothetical protein GCM10023080_083680 [Streptomyces pseudoechinosporeus]